MTALLEVEDLCVEFTTERGVVRAVDHVSFSIDRGDTLGIVGESGCGKTVTSLALLGLVPTPPGRIAGGQIRLDGTNLVGLGEKALRRIRGSRISLIFQEPMTALNPVFTIGNQMTDVIRLHEGLDRVAARERAAEMLAQVGIPIPTKRLDEYPHELSGGMRQRVMIAMALSCNPDVLVADEPTTALDVTTQAQVLEQIVKLQDRLGMAVILITHDLGVIAESCERALVMYCGRVIEDAATADLYRDPQHPYTRGLLNSIPRIREDRPQRLPVIPGTVPDLLHMPPGCRFATRCQRHQPICDSADPPLTAAGASQAACYFPGAQGDDHG
ncbi:MAG: ABC transporter ATP-binding protein [Gammaproteobacteria bacterium]|nr:ABC transporter ATP-binding protein [Gammaproteobacteria bacterium]